MSNLVNITMVSRQRLVGANNGSSAYLIALARSLCDAGCAVHLIQPSPTIAGRTPLIRLQREMAVFATHSVRGALRIGDWLVFVDPSIWFHAAIGMIKRLSRRFGARGRWAQDRPRPYAVATEWKSADHAFLQARLPAQTRAVIADYMFCAPAFEDAGAEVARAIVMHDLFHSREGAGRDSVALVDRDQEITMLARADTVIAIQAAERNFVDQHVPGARGLLAVMPAETVEKAAPGEDDRVLFVGSNTAPNSVGLRWFLDEVWPLVLARRPQCRLDIIGSVDRAFDNRDYPNVAFHGLVDELASFYRDAGVVVSPLTFGSGLKIKLIEGLAAGKAMVVTSITLQGVEDCCEHAVVRADDPARFAEVVADLAGSLELRRDLAQAGLECARSNFTAEVAHAELRAWARSLAPRN